MYGPPVSVAPDDVGQIVVGVDTRDTAGRPSGKHISLGAAEYRRSVYIQVRRSMPLGLLQAFDGPLMTPNCERRASSTVSPQALLMMNSAFVGEQAQAMASRIEKETSADPASRLRAAWRLVFAVSPTDREVRDGLAFLVEQGQALDSEKPVKTRGVDRHRLPLADLCQALMISNGLLYVD
jgi:hypothetical protein